ncbi:hypothetical protein ACFXJ8_33915 [Nonomuraea sp. NPDC059194]|uniref:hypothetical protein n=1 Tax=Nonomuraea sp. NPDC059194 TaxID=3346764 RepID=UPI0036AB200C
MAFWRKRSIVDPDHGDLLARQLRAALTRRDWPTAAGMLSGVRHPDDRDFYLDICSEIDNLQDWIDEWIAAEPGSTLPLLVKGVHGVSWAWEARGGGRASETSHEQFKEFHRRLKTAEDCLDEVVERDPDDTEAWAALVTSARGRRVNREEAERRFGNVVKRHPAHRTAHEQMLQYLCGKWFGSDEEMWEFARAAPLPHLITVAYLETWIEHGREALDNDETRAELRATAQRVDAYPGHRDPGWDTVENVLAFTFCLADDYAAAAERFRRIGDRATDWPWFHLKGGADKQFKLFRTVAFKSAG